MADTDFSDFVTVAQAAEEFKTSRPYWYDMIKAGKIPAYELPGKRGVFLKRSDILAFWHPREVDPKTIKRDDTSA